jgi:hypothetical protein
MSDINSDPLLVDKPDWFKRLIAGFVDVASTWENASANNGFLRTALTRRAVTDLCALIDYVPVPQVTASGTMMFDADPAAIMPFTVLQTDVAANGSSSMGSSAQRYGARGPLTFNTLLEVVVQDSGHISTSTGQIVVASVFTTGEKVRASSSVTLPTGILAGTDYFAIYVDVTHVQLAATRALAFSGTALVPSAVGSGNLTLTRLSQAISCYQQNDVAYTSIGSSDGVTPWQEFDISQVGVLSDTLTVTVNGQAYVLVTTLALSAPTDNVFRLYYNTDGTCTIRFGNGVYGAIPPAAPVYVSYSYGGGLASNVAYPNQIVSYAGGDPRIKGCFNTVAFTGGNDAESLDSAKKNAPMLLKARSRFITIQDGIALAMAYGGLSLVQINRNTYGVLSCQVVGVATGGGNPSLATRTAIASYLLGLSMMSAVDVHFDAATLTPVTAAMNVRMTMGYLWTAISSYVSFAVKLYFAESGAEILAAYLSGGISLAVTKINLILSFSFQAADYAPITAILNTFNTTGARNFGDVIQLSDLYALCSAIPGVDYVVLTSSTPSIPYSEAANEITTMTGGSVTLTQV